MIKKIIPGIVAVLLCGSLSANILPVHAAYESAEEVAFSLRGISGGYIPKTNPNQIYISPEDAANGTVVQLSMYIEADYADISYISAALESPIEQIIFKKDTFQSPTSFAYSTEQEFTLPDGTSFSTRFKPFCFGRFNSIGNYEHGSYSFLADIKENSMVATWSYDLANKTTFSPEFLGGSSDTFSFMDFEMQILPETAADTYGINYIQKDSFVKGATYLTSDDSIPDPDNPGKYISKYFSLVPTLKPMEIIICDTNPVMDMDAESAEQMNCFRFAHDARDFSIEDFPAEIAFSYGGQTFTENSIDLLETFTAGNPGSLYVEKPMVLENVLTLAGTPLENSSGEQASLNYYIGQKGDVNADGIVNVTDAGLILQYSAKKGAGEEAFLTDGTDSVQENFAYFLADINGESQNSGEDGSVLNATDASLILTYAAMTGSGQSVDWDVLLAR